MFVELTLASGEIEDVNTDHIRSMRQINNATGPDAQPDFCTVITFISGKTEKYRGARADVKATMRLVGAR